MPDELKELTLDDAINSFNQPRKISTEQALITQKNLTKNLIRDQTRLLVSIINIKDIPRLEKYLASLNEDLLLEDTFDYRISDNFLTTALAVNEPIIIDMLLKFIFSKKCNNHMNYALAFVSLAYISKVNIENNLHLKLQSYLDTHDSASSIINSYGLHILSLTILSDNITNCAFLIIKYLFIKHYNSTRAINLATCKSISNLPVIFKYTILNKHFDLAILLLKIINHSDRAILLNYCNDKIALIHQCLEIGNFEGISFLMENGADICSTRCCTYQIKTPNDCETKWGFLTIFEIVIINNDHHTLRILMNNVINAIVDKKIKDATIFLQHLAEVCNNCSNIRAFNVFNEFDINKMLFQENEPPNRTQIKDDMLKFYDAINEWLVKYYQNKNKYALMRKIQPDYIQERLEEIDMLLDILNRFIIKKKSSLLCRYIGFSYKLQQLPESQKASLNHAINRLAILGHGFDSDNISHIHIRLQEIKVQLIAHKENLTNNNKILHEYDTDDLSISLLPCDIIDENNGDTLMNFTKSSYRTPLLKNNTT